MSNIEEFRAHILKLHENRKHKINKSLGVYDAYKWIRKNKWLSISRPISEHEFYSVVRTMNNYLADELVNGNDINLPHRLGKLEIRKNPARISIEEGKLKTNLPIDWDRTLKLWYENEDALKAKTLVRQEEKELFKVIYNKSRANYNNQCFYLFDINRDIKRRLKQRIKGGRLDAFMLQWN